MAKKNPIKKFFESSGGGHTGWKSTAQREEEQKAFEKVRDVLDSVENLSQLDVAVKTVNIFIERYGIRNDSPEYKYLERILNLKKLQLGVKRRSRMRSDENEDPSVRSVIKKILKEEFDEEDSDIDTELDEEEVIDEDSYWGNDDNWGTDKSYWGKDPKWGEGGSYGGGGDSGGSEEF